jgi:hypothetical protein
MEAVRTSETSVNFYQTVWCNISEDTHLRTHHRENLKSQEAAKFVFLLPLFFVYLTMRLVSSFV